MPSRPFHPSLQIVFRNLQHRLVTGNFPRNRAMQCQTSCIENLVIGVTPLKRMSLGLPMPDVLELRRFLALPIGPHALRGRHRVGLAGATALLLWLFHVFTVTRYDKYMKWKCLETIYI